MGMEDRIYWAAVAMVPGMGAAAFAWLCRQVGSPRSVWEARGQDIAKLAGPGKRSVVENLLEFRSRVRIADIANILDQKGINFITIEERGYPVKLKEISDPPPVLFYRGRLLPPDFFAIAVVGTRRPTPYGLAMAERLASELASQGVVVVSGMARGIDGSAHRGALKAGGKTIAVLGCGVDIVYPPEHRRLMDEIIESGLVLSEFPPGTPPWSQNFPLRNRIISGLAFGVVVVEARERSGALITADLALGQGRDVFAVPGPVTSEQSRGPLQLLKDGAKIVTGAADVLEEYGLSERETSYEQVTVGLEEEVVLNYISYTPIHIDELVEKTGLNVHSLGAILTHLELKGLISRLPGSMYSRK